MWLAFGAAMRSAISARHADFATFITMDVCGVDRARNYLLAHAMAQGADWLLMVDSDTWTDNGGGLLTMILAGAQLEATIIGAPVYRSVDGKQMLNVYQREDGKRVCIDPRDMRAGGVIPFEVDSIGSAVMAIDLHRVPADLSFKFTEDTSEDLYFCEGIKKAGGKIYCDRRIETNHIKSYTMTYKLGELSTNPPERKE
jgi:hypothetical protein